MSRAITIRGESVDFMLNLHAEENRARNIVLQSEITSLLQPPTLIKVSLFTPIAGVTEKKRKITLKQSMFVVTSERIVGPMKFPCSYSSTYAQTPSKLKT